ncbi:MAG: hypothetical protein KOO60_02890, partial [Gemmatimonadales bacterium]|nr:hypothetical protein [Gemmatimonadales bacterium]
MNRFALFAYLAVALMFALDSPAGEMPQHTNSNLSVIHGGNQEMSHSASRDSVYLIGPWGSGAVVNGQFQDQG